jgi:hypothetical protein
VGIAGAASGASRALEEIVAQRILQQKLEQEVAERQQRFAMEQSRIDEGKRQFDVEAGQRNRQLDAADTERRARSDREATERSGRSDMAAVLAMPGMSNEAKQSEILGSGLRTGSIDPIRALEATKPPDVKKHAVTVNQGGRPFRKLVTEDELAQGVPEYREPSSGSKPDYQRVVVDGKETFLTPEEVRARGGVDAASRKRASTGMERQALGFYNRMKDALDTMDAVEDQVTERDLMLINNSPLPDLINNRLLSTAGQQYAQALQTYTEGRLRKESGAAIADTEYANDRKTIGRQANDQDVVRAQKRQTRRKTHEGIGYAAGPAFEEFYGEPFQRMPDTSAAIQRPIPGIEGGIAESTDGGKTWRRVQ